VRRSKALNRCAAVDPHDIIGGVSSVTENARRLKRFHRRVDAEPCPTARFPILSCVSSHRCRNEPCIGAFCSRRSARFRLEVLGGASPTPQDALSYAFRRDLYAAAHARGAESVKRHLHSLPELADENVLVRRLPRDVAEIPLGRPPTLS